MPRRALALLIVLAFVPLCAANQAPIPIPIVKAEAVLNEPVLFTDGSVDPDGSIASAAWTFTDGRTMTGHEVTKRFDFAGVHTMLLEVTDDLGARSSVEFQLLVRAPLMHGRAYALASSQGTQADTGDVGANDQTASDVVVAGADQGALHAAGLEAELRTYSDWTVARADVAVVHVPHPFGFFHLTGVEAEAVSGCHQAWRFADVGKLRLNDAPLVPPGAVAPNTRVDLPDGTIVILNAQDEPAPDRIAVTAVRILVPGQAPIEIAHAEAGVSFCPYEG
ncbi:MAG TPA: PKD domain-containing protein [Candidatus Thermoplasmatota archaeon]|nr:PKD domain-containing protein [Candidatus Thermoplasmatota archaeon]